MKFREIIFEWLLTENKEKIYQKYYSDIDRGTFIRIIKGDPKTVVTDDKIIDIGKHARLLLDMYKKGELRFEDLVKSNEYLTIIYDHNIPLDYKNIKTISDIFGYVKHKIPKIAVTINQILDSLEPKEYDIKYNGPSWIIIVPKTEKSASYLGVNTEWCTAWGKHCLNPKYNERNNHFENLNHQGPLYIIINKSNINEKYQIHFESNQMKGVDDSEVRNRSDFFDKKPDVKLFFFPSLSDKNSVDTLKGDLDRSKKFLSSIDIKTLLVRFVENFGNKENDLFVSFLNNDVDEVLNKIENDYGLRELSFTDNNVLFEFRKLPPSLESIYGGISYLESESNNSYDTIYNEESNYLSEDDGYEMMESYLSGYYEKNRPNLIKRFGNVTKTYDSFKNTFMSGVVKNRDVIDGYLEKYSELNSLSYDSAIESELRTHSNVIEFVYGNSYKDVTISLVKMLEYVSDRDIRIINDLDDFFENFGYYFDLSNQDYYPEIEYQRSSPDNEYMHGLLEDYFDMLEEKIKDDREYGDSIYDGECLKVRNSIMDIVNKHFDENNVFENEFVKIEIDSDWLDNFDCKSGIYVTFTSKKTNKTDKGYMQVDSIMNNINMEPLFENIYLKIMLEINKGGKY